MKVRYDNKEYDVTLLDDGTLDTVLSVNSREYRFDSEYARTADGDITDDAINDAIEAYLDDTEGLT